MIVSLEVSELHEIYARRRSQQNARQRSVSSTWCMFGRVERGSFEVAGKFVSYRIRTI